MKFRSSLIATAVLVTLLPLAAPLRACCDDFWSCAAAVATGGLSCAVENLVNSIKNLIQNVAKLASTLANQAADVVNLAKSELDGAANDLRNLANQAESDFNTAATTASSIVNEASRPAVRAVAPLGSAVGAVAGATRGGAASATHAASGAAGVVGGHVPVPVTGAGAAGAGTVMHFDPPVDNQAVLDALRRAQQAVDGLRPDVFQPLNQARQFATQAGQQVANAASSAANIAGTALLAPLQTLGNMLTDLVNHPERIFDPSKIVDDAITQITNQVVTTMTQVHDAVMQQAKGTLDLAQKPLQDALDRTAVAKKIVAAMQRLEQTKSKSALDALNTVVPRQRVDVRMLVSQVASATHASGMTALNLNQNKTLVMAPFNRITASRLTARTVGTQMGMKLKGPWQEFKRLQALPPKVDPAAKTQVEAELTRRFAGKTPAQAEAEKRIMLNEARARFAKDPQTLRKLEAMLDSDPVIKGHLGPHSPVMQGQ